MKLSGRIEDVGEAVLDDFELDPLIAPNFLMVSAVNAERQAEQENGQEQREVELAPE